MMSKIKQRGVAQLWLVAALAALLVVAAGIYYLTSGNKPGADPAVASDGQPASNVEQFVLDNRVSSIAAMSDPQAALVLPATLVLKLSGNIEPLIGQTAKLTQSSNEKTIYQTIPANGQLDFVGLDSGAVDIVVEMPGRAVSVRDGVVQQMPSVDQPLVSLMLASGANTREVTVAEHLNPLFRIRVTLDEQPAEGVVIFARSIEAQRKIFAQGERQVSREEASADVVAATTNAFGVAEFDTLTPGEWTFLARSPSGTWSWSYPEFVDLSNMATGDVLEFAITTARGNILVVNPADEAPIGGKELHFYSNFAEPGFRLTSNSDGVINARIPVGTYYVEPYPRDLRQAVQIEWTSDSAERMVIPLVP